MYASLLRPELSYYASRLGKVMSAPSEPHMVLARKALQFISGTLEERHTFHPPGHAAKFRRFPPTSAPPARCKWIATSRLTLPRNTPSATTTLDTLTPHKLDASLPQVYPR